MKYTFKQFQAEFPDDAACLAKLMEVNYRGTKITCPGCGVVGAQFHAMGKRRAFACQECGHHIYPCAGTIFHKSSTKLTNWFFAMYLMTSTRHGVAAKELERQIGCTYKTAWRMAHELRKLMATADYQGPLGNGGAVEMDEVFVGGKQKGHKGKGRGGNKAIVFGMIERDGNMRATVIPEVKARTIEPIVLANVAPGSTLYTDTNSSYRHIAKRGGYQHEKVNHLRKEYARGPVHVNTLEGHWGQLKRSIKGTHIHVSHKHMWKYVSEFSYRRNMRHSHRAMFSKLVSSFSLPRLLER